MKGAAPLVAVLVLLSAACGARLTPEQRLAGIGALGQGGAVAQGEKNPADLGSSQTQSGGQGSSTNTNTTGGAGGGIGAPKPATGNDGATDVGVSGTQITIATVSDIGGIQPGLFKSTHQAVSALAAYVNSQGGIYGRALKPLLLDSRTNSSDNAAAVTDACDKAFALVGSMSAFDDGGVKPGESCKIPDISAITVNGARTMASNVFPAYPVRPDYLAIGNFNYMKAHYPDVIAHAGMIYLDAAVARAVSQQRVRTLEKNGWKFVYNQQIGLVEGNYNPFVQDMKKAGVRYLDYVGDYQSIVRILQEAQDEQYHIDVVDLDSVAYSPKFLSDGGSAIEGVNVFLNTSLLEEASSNPEMQLYESWLQRVAPGATPDYFGLYAWSAGRLFVKAATDAGPHLTRAGLFGALRNVHDWTGYGMHEANDIGNKIPTNCFLYVHVFKGHFVRRDPPSGWICNQGGLVKT